MNTIVISLIEKKSHPDGGTINHIKSAEVLHIQSTARYLQLSEIEKQKEIPILVEIQNQQLTNVLDCTAFSPYELWYFDEKYQFTGKAYSLNEEPKSYQIQTQAKWILVVHLRSTEYDNLKHFQCSELDVSNSYQFSKSEFPKYYGVFPYFIINHLKSPCFTQIPIQVVLEDTVKNGLQTNLVEVSSAIFNDENEKTKVLIDYFKVVYLKTNRRESESVKMALVLAPDLAYYLTESNQEPAVSNSIPSGGVLLDMNGRIIATYTKHYR